MKKVIYFIFFIFLAFIYQLKNNEEQLPLIAVNNFQTNIDGKEVSLYTLRNANGMTAQITNYGGRIVSLWVPDREAHWTDIVLGHDSIDKYIHNGKAPRPFGAVMGRVANRIAHARFSLNGKTYQLEPGRNGHIIHGGVHGFDRKVWNVDSIAEDKIVLSYVSADMEEGFPGNLKVSMTYTITPQNEFRIDYLATTDQATPVNLTNHSFFNLKGEGNGTIDSHRVQILCNEYTPFDDTAIPTGEIASVENTPFDLRDASEIGKQIESAHQRFPEFKNYDQNYVVNHVKNHDLALAAIVYEPSNGIEMKTYTTQPGVQFYIASGLNPIVKGKAKKTYEPRGAFALETQHFPDSPNHANFPSCIVTPEKPYQETCIYQFGIRKE